MHASPFVLCQLTSEAWQPEKDTRPFHLTENAREVRFVRWDESVIMSILWKWHLLHARARVITSADLAICHDYRTITVRSNYTHLGLDLPVVDCVDGKAHRTCQNRKKR